MSRMRVRKDLLTKILFETREKERWQRRCRRPWVSLNLHCLFQRQRRNRTNVAILCLFVFFQRARVAWHVLRRSYGMRTLAYPTLCIIMSLCSFASLVDRACGPSRENPNAVRGDRDVKAHLKPCNNILTDIESIDSERKLLLIYLFNIRKRNRQNKVWVGRMRTLTMHFNIALPIRLQSK